MQKDRNITRKKRHMKLRSSLFGTTERPRLNVYRSNVQIYAQVIDDTKGVTLVSCSTVDTKVRDTLSDKRGLEKAHLIGVEIARLAQEAGISKVVFDRGGYAFHGQIKAVAEGARTGGLSF